MKKLNIVVLIAVMLGLTGCPSGPGQDRRNEPTDYEPVVMDRKKMENAIKIENPRPIKDAGKIYVYPPDSMIFINEKYKGIHIIDNKDPENPIKEGFIRIPGNLDISIKNRTLLADNATDLVAIELSGYKSISVSKRLRNVFPEYMPPDFGTVPEQYKEPNRPDSTVIVEWVKK